MERSSNEKTYPIIGRYRDVGNTESSNQERQAEAYSEKGESQQLVLVSRLTMATI